MTLHGEPMTGMTALQSGTATDAATVWQAYAEVRSVSERICAPLEVEDYGLQAMPDASPPKWHLAHTTWFWENFLLGPHRSGYQPFHPQFSYLFNSYYEAVGPRHARPQRGLLSRPTVAETYAYRKHVDGAMEQLLAALGEGELSALLPLLQLGLNHEQQHQELLLTDTLYHLSVNPLRPAHFPGLPAQTSEPVPLEWSGFEGGVGEQGYAGGGFFFDNEGPRHAVYLQPFCVANRLATNAEYLAFMEDGGYRRAEFWLSDGWRTVQERGWESPLYWEAGAEGWQRFTPGGMRLLDANAPVCHVSFYEADAFARWSGKRLPTEAEWERASIGVPAAGNLQESGLLQPVSPAPAPGMRQLFGDVWEWTASPYLAYPGYQPAPGAVGEYNGKFMCNQMVLRGGSCATPASHIRSTYRNFFPPDARWQFSGIRLAE